MWTLIRLGDHLHLPILVSHLLHDLLLRGGSLPHVLDLTEPRPGWLDPQHIASLLPGSHEELRGGDPDKALAPH